MVRRGRLVDGGKWVATGVQLVGHGLTGLNVVPLNAFAFFAGIASWFAAGLMWNDRAIMVVHLGAFVSLLVGHSNGLAPDVRSGVAKAGRSG